MGGSLHLGETELEPISMISIRKANPKDCDTILIWENDPSIWEVTDEPGPFVREDIEDFIREKNSLIETRQERWMIEHHQTPIGMIDLFQWDPQKNSVGVGIAIPDLQFRKKGFATSALRILHNVLFNRYQILNFHCIINPQNPDSIKLFQKLGYMKTAEIIHLKQKVHRFEKNIQP